MDKTIRWGILGCGNIANKFAADLQMASGSTLHAVAAQDLGRAKNFAKKYTAEKAYKNYTDLVNDPDLDVVYVATTHNFHYEHTALCLDGNKAVLCEKPICVNDKEAKELVELSRKKNIFLMEAMWTRFLPHIAKVREILARGILGEIFTIHADFGRRLTENNNPRLWEPKLAGGALLDLGIYPVSFSHLVLGAPSSIVAQATFTDKGVDAQTSAVFTYENGAQSIISASSHTQTPCTAHISGFKGFLEIDQQFYCPTAMRIVLHDGSKMEYPNTYKGHGLREQAIEFAHCVRSGKIESPLLPHNESISVMESMDEIRRQVGLRYPNE